MLDIIVCNKKLGIIQIIAASTEGNEDQKRVSNTLRDPVV